MKPYGLVAAASITSHTSSPRRRHISATSLARPMLMARKVFSSSFTISALWLDETGTTRSKIVWKTRTASSVQSGVSPPTTFGTSRTANFLLAGSMRSGENASAKSTPTWRPDSSSIGTKSSWVVPG